MIIQHITDNDLYKFTMQNAVINKYPLSKVKYKFINRGTENFPEGFALKLQAEVDAMSNLSLTDEEYEYLRKRCYYLPPTYLDFLRGYRYNPSEVIINQEGGRLSVTIEGYWYRTILWEVPLMAIISELYFQETGQTIPSQEQADRSTVAKCEKYQQLGVKIAEFGTRRRYSYANHERVVSILNNYAPDTFVGTSNVYLAMKYNTTPIGTHAHEWFMFHAAQYGVKYANRSALDNWVNVYRGDLGIALSDTYTTEVFFRDFDTLFAKLFDGVRHDSGDPIEFAQKTINHYKSLRINPLSKTIVFSDALNPELVEKIAEFSKGKIGMSFGIGTNFTNDVGVKPLNMVIKLSHVLTNGQWTEVVKLSDNPIKHTGNAEIVGRIKAELGI
ncbi:MAG: nicotinate phosphoribosyltransferase [Bacteroidales bacterium]|nr:nicotinate phosphoribosyltransferase [Bacteroidales bacterium]